MPESINDRDRVRGARFKWIRENEMPRNHDGRSMTQEQFAVILNKAASALGLPANYKGYTVSRIEKGGFDVEDMVVWMSIDPHKRSYDWLIFGEDNGHEQLVKPSASISRRVPHRRRGA